MAKRAARALTTIFGNGARAPGIGKISGVSVKIGKIVYRLRTNQNLATELDLAIVAKRSFKNCVYFKHVLLNLKIVKKLQANTRLKLLTTLNILCKHFWENPEKKFLQKTPFLFISENENS